MEGYQEIQWDDMLFLSQGSRDVSELRWWRWWCGVAVYIACWDAVIQYTHRRAIAVTYTAEKGGNGIIQPRQWAIEICMSYTFDKKNPYLSGLYCTYGYDTVHKTFWSVKRNRKKTEMPFGALWKLSKRWATVRSRCQLWYFIHRCTWKRIKWTGAPRDTQHTSAE